MTLRGSFALKVTLLSSLSTPWRWQKFHFLSSVKHKEGFVKCLIVFCLYNSSQKGPRLLGSNVLNVLQKYNRKNMMVSKWPFFLNYTINLCQNYKKFNTEVQFRVKSSDSWSMIKTKCLSQSMFLFIISVYFIYN